MLARHFAFLGLLLLTLPGVNLVAQRLAPLPVVTNLAPGPLTPAQITELALIFSGTDNLDADTSRLENLEAELRIDLGKKSGSELADALLQRLHQTLLKRYSTLQTRLDLVLRDGTYNCVSSALLYMITGRTLGLNVQAVSVPSHVFCRVLIGSQSFDVETTTPEGFDPGTKKTFKDTFNGTTGYSYVPPGHYSERTEIGARGLLGLLLQNQIAALEAQGHPDQALGPAIDRWVLEKSGAAFATLSVSFQNSIAKYNRQKNYAEALALIKTLESWTGTTQLVHELADTVVSNEAIERLNALDFEGAIKLADTWQTSGELEAQFAQRIRSTAWDNQLTQNLDSLPIDQAQALIEAAWNKGHITSDRRVELLARVASLQAVKIAKDQHFEDAVNELRALPPEVQASPEVSQLMAQILENWSADFHNRFAQLWNAGQQAQAKKVLKEGLAKIPDSHLLRSDWNQLANQP